MSINYYEAKHDKDKSRVDLITPEFIFGMGNVLKYGANVYGEDAWMSVPDGQKRYYAAAMRHLLSFKQGQINDIESGLPHLLHAATNLMMLYHVFNQEEI